MTNDLESADVPYASPGNIDELLQNLVDQANQGTHVNIESVCRQHPHWDKELRAVLPALVLFDHSRRFVDTDSICRFDSEHGRRIANYQIGRVIGRGGMGVVYEATQSPLGRRVAVKLLKDVEATAVARRRFEQEFRIVASLHHTNIVPVFDAGEDHGQLYFAMQLIDGVRVSQWRKSESARTYGPTATAIEDSTVPFVVVSDRRRGQSDNAGHETPPGFSPGKQDDVFLRIASLGIQIATALQFAHARGILHRDIKPANILIDANENAWVTDFGLAKPDDGENLTDSGDVAGTIRYLAPERLRGKCDARSDVYSLGLVLLELITERPAWNEASGGALIRKLSGGETCPFPTGGNVPTDLRLIVNKAIQPHPEMRYSTAREMAEDLVRFVEARPILARRFSYLRSAVLWARRNPTVAALWATTILALAGGGITAAILAFKWQTAATAAAEREQEVTIERDRAMKSLQLTREAVVKMTSSIADRYYTHNNPLTELDRQNLNQIRQFYERLGSLETTIEPTRSGTARGLQVMSGIRYKLGQINQAKQELTESNSIFQSLVIDSPLIPEYRLALAEGLLQLGILESENHERDKGIESFFAAKQHFLALPKSPELQMRSDEGLQAVLSNIGTCHFLAERWDEAESYFRKSIELQRQLVHRDPDNLGQSSNLANSLSNMVLCLIELEKFADAQAVAAESAALHLKIAEQDNSAENRFSASVSWIVRGKVDLLGGQSSAALRSYQEAERIANRLVSDYPSVPKFRYHWSSTLSELADWYSEMERHAEATECHAREVEIRQELVNEVPDQLNYRGGLAESLDFLAAQFLVETPDKAIGCWRESIRNFDEIIRANTDLLWAHEERNNVIVRMADCYQKQLRNPDEALDLLVQAETTWRSLAERFPNDTRFVVWQSGTAQAVARILLEQGKRPEGIARLREALSIVERISPGQEYYAAACKNAASIKAAIAATDNE